MTIDERLEALVTTVELHAHDMEDIRRSIQDLKSSTADLVRVSVHNSEQIDGLIIAARNLLTSVEVHERRLRRLEGRQ